MTDHDLRAELEQLRDQLQALQRKHDEAASAKAEPETSTAESGAASSFENILGEMDLGNYDIAGQVRELLESLDNDIKNTKPSTLLIVFALGVLIGRLR
jgi:23S rRNA maturation mini-RNase III